MNPKDSFFAKVSIQGRALTYGDVRLKTGHTDFDLDEINFKSRFSRNVPLMMPIVSSPMDTVTETKMAIAMAKLGGLGIIHRALSPKDQTSMVGKVKHHLNAKIDFPICVKNTDTAQSVMNMRQEKGFSFYSFPVLDSSGRLVGIVTKNDFDFCSDPSKPISAIMSTGVVSAPSQTTIQEAYDIMVKNSKKILPIVDQGIFKGIYTFADVKRIISGNSDSYNIDESGNLRVGAAIGVGQDAVLRMEQLSERKVDVVVIDTAHGDSKAVIDTIIYCKRNYPDIDIVAGNISEAESAKRLISAGADGLRIGQGPGSICTTRIIAGIGCPQVTAVYNCAKAAQEADVPICADGGIQYSGDVTIALGAGADNVMLGNMLAGTDEAPGETVTVKGVRYRKYRGMGSLSAMKDNKSSRERYNQNGKDSYNKLVPEGVEGLVPDRGSVNDVIYQITEGLRSGLGYVGAKDVKALQAKADFYEISSAGLTESHPHHLVSIEGSPNYKS